MEVIILSGHGSEETIRDGLKYGALAYLTKPCDFEELLFTIRKAIPDFSNSNAQSSVA